MRHLLDITDFSVEEINGLIYRALDIIENPNYYREACRYKKLATLFYEPSTRTRLSFEAAMMELGGNVIGFEAGNASSSASKGETVGDTVRTVSNYADIIVMRHNLEGAPYAAVQVSGVPIINAGDGGHNHPTQTLADLLTIYRKKGTFDNLTIGLCGDLKYGRTVHSLIRALLRYKNPKFVLISPKELALPEYILDVMRKNGAGYVVTESMEEYMGDLDILYMTRVQQERFDTKEEYERLKDCYILTPEKLEKAKSKTCVLHPLPRVNEISVDVDIDQRACYFEQVANGKYMRMALILKLLNAAKNNEVRPVPTRFISDIPCPNPKCITSREENLPKYATKSEDGKTCRCYYCESIIK